MTASSLWLRVAVVAAAFIAMLGLRAQPARNTVLPLTALPGVIAGATAQPLDVEPLLIERSRVSSFLARRYAAAGAPDAVAFELHVCYYAALARNRWTAQPGFCHQEQAWVTLRADLMTVPLGGGELPVRMHLVQRNEERAVVMLWNQGRGHVAANKYRVKWNLVRDSLLRRRSDEALVRVFVPITTDQAAASALAAEVAAEVVPHLERILPPR